MRGHALGTCVGPVGAPGPKEPNYNRGSGVLYLTVTTVFDQILTVFGYFGPCFSHMPPPAPVILGAVDAEGQWGTRGGCMDGSEPNEPRCNCTSGCVRVVYISRVMAGTEGGKSVKSDSLWSTARLS